MDLPGCSEATAVATVHRTLAKSRLSSVGADGGGRIRFFCGKSTAVTIMSNKGGRIRSHFHSRMGMKIKVSCPSNRA